MKRLRRFLTIVVAITVALTLAPKLSVAASWTPQALENESTLEFLSVEADDNEHWSPVWLVVIDGNLYLRLGNRAVRRLTGSQIYPLTAVRVAGEEFRPMVAIEANDMAERVAKAMGEKYFSDILVRHWPHPLTVRLRTHE